MQDDGAALPPDLSEGPAGGVLLDHVSIAATFIAMTIPAMKNLPMVAATLVSGGTALVTKPLLAEIHIIVSALAGMVVGYVLHRMRR